MASSAIVLGLLGLTTGTALADGQVWWTGNGTTEGQLDNNKCAESGGVAYLYWVFNPGGNDTVTAASITFGGTGSGTYAMNTDNGTWKLQNGPWFDLSGLTAVVNYTGNLGNGNPVVTISHGCPGTEESAPPSFEQSEAPGTEVPPSEAPSFEQSEAPETEAPPSEVPPSEVPSEVPPSEAPPSEVPPSEAPSFEQSQAGDTDIPTEPNTATVGGNGSSGPSSNAWLLVLALGLLLGSVVVMTPATSKSKTRR